MQLYYLNVDSISKYKFTIMSPPFVGGLIIVFTRIR